MQSPLQEGLLDAARRGATDEVDALLDELSCNATWEKDGADGAAGYDGRTPLMEAARSGDVATVELLLEKGKSHVERRNVYGTTALFLAASSGRVAVVGALIAAGALVETPNDEGVTPLIIAAYNGHIQVVRTLLDAGVDVECVDKHHGHSALAAAHKQGHSEIVELLRTHMRLNANL